MKKAVILVAWVCAAVLACSSDPAEIVLSGDVRDLSRDNDLAVTVVLPVGAPEYLEMAARDLLGALAESVGVAKAPAPVFIEGQVGLDDLPRGISILANVDLADADALVLPTGDERLQQGFTVGEVTTPNRVVLRISSQTALGAAYGLYTVADAQGVRWYHPRETFVAPAMTLTDVFSGGATITPRYRMRGFHQHTQHPIVWSDYLLKPDEANRGPITEYFRYLLRNRQNAFDWHMLGTVEVTEWEDHAKWIIAEGHRHGIEIGMFIGFADKQQNAYQLVRDLHEEDPVNDRIIAQKHQVTVGLDVFADYGFDYLGFQFGTTEMTSLSDAETLNWFSAAVEWCSAHDVDLWAWVHAPSELKAEDGETPFFHLPKMADEQVGMFVHTTMFYDLEHPAPVYNNDDFAHQAVLIAEQAGKRPLAYFPETAWWLGFDNSLPLFLPVTGFSRAHDVEKVLPELMGDVAMDGHVTFTTGIEWNYWMFDHFVARLAWDDGPTWREYASDVSMMYGTAAPAVEQALVDVTNRQVEDFYGDNPLIFFYLAGESANDEIGAVGGLVGRPVKVAYWDVYNADDATYSTWLEGDYAQVEDMAAFYRDVADTLDSADPGADTIDAGLADRFLELNTSIKILALRAEHSKLLYGAVISARDHDEGAAYADLSSAKAISNTVKELVAKVEQDVYRYPLELLAREKPDTLTAYPFGYLYETSTAHFWTRRDDQVQQLLDIVFEKVKEEWDVSVVELYMTDSDDVTAIEPDIDEGIKNLIAQYVPTILLALGPSQDMIRPVAFANDLNANGKPDIGTQIVGQFDLSKSVQLVEFERLPITIGSAGAPVGTLTLRGGGFEVKTGDVNYGQCEMYGQVNFEDLLSILVNTGMFDQEGAWEMVASQFGIPVDTDPRPESFPMRIRSPLIQWEE